jgi:hypothetical protein
MSRRKVQSAAGGRSKVKVIKRLVGIDPPRQRNKVRGDNNSRFDNAGTFRKSNTQSSPRQQLIPAL